MQQQITNMTLVFDTQISEKWSLFDFNLTVKFAYKIVIPQKAQK